MIYQWCGLVVQCFCTGLSNHRGQYFAFSCIRGLPYAYLSTWIWGLSGSQSQCAQASFVIEEGVEIALCPSWMKHHILLLAFWLVSQVVFSFRSCPTCECKRGDGIPWHWWLDGCYGEGDVKPQVSQCLWTSAVMSGMQTLKLSWVFHQKFKNGIFKRSQDWIVARDNHWCPGIDYGELISPVMCLESLCTILALVAIRNLGIIQFDINSAYLHSTLKEEAYMEQPEGYVTPGKKGWVCCLKKGLYRLAWAGRTWNKVLNAHMQRGLRQQPHIQQFTSKPPGQATTLLQQDSGWITALQ